MWITEVIYRQRTGTASTFLSPIALIPELWCLDPFCPASLSHWIRSSFLQSDSCPKGKQYAAIHKLPWHKKWEMKSRRASVGQDNCYPLSEQVFQTLLTAVKRRATSASLHLLYKEGARLDQFPERIPGVTYFQQRWSLWFPGELRSAVSLTRGLRKYILLDIPHLESIVIIYTISCFLIQET